MQNCGYAYRVDEENSKLIKAEEFIDFQGGRFWEDKDQNIESLIYDGMSDRKQYAEIRVGYYKGKETCVEIVQGSRFYKPTDGHIIRRALGLLKNRDEMNLYGDDEYIIGL